MQIQNKIELEAHMKDLIKIGLPKWLKITKQLEIDDDYDGNCHIVSVISDAYYNINGYRKINKPVDPFGREGEQVKEYLVKGYSNIWQNWEKVKSLTNQYLTGVIDFLEDIERRIKQDKPSVLEIFENALKDPTQKAPTMNYIHLRRTVFLIWKNLKLESKQQSNPSKFFVDFETKMVKYDGTWIAESDNQDVCTSLKNLICSIISEPKSKDRANELVHMDLEIRKLVLELRNTLNKIAEYKKILGSCFECKNLQ